MLWLLDTNIISEAWKPSPDPAVIAFMAAQKDECAISEICFSELYYGLHRLPFGKRRNDLERHIQFLRQDYEETILVFGAAEAYSWGEYAAELFASRGKAYFTARSIRDSAIGATARAWSLTVVTRDTNGFPFCQTLNPFRS